MKISTALFLVVLEMTLFSTAEFKMIHCSGGMATVAFAALPFYTTAILQEMITMWLQKWLPIVPLVDLPPNLQGEISVLDSMALK